MSKNQTDNVIWIQFFITVAGGDPHTCLHVHVHMCLFTFRKNYQIPISHQQMPPQHQIARGDFEPKPLGGNWASPHWAGDQEKEVGKDLPHAALANIKHHQASFEWNPRENVKWVDQDRTGGGVRTLERGWSECHGPNWEPNVLEECGYGPMFLEE